MPFFVVVQRSRNMQIKMFHTSVTVAIPSYNAEEFILDTIQSILNQTSPVDEIIICDDCSTDNTVAKIREFIHSGNFNIRLILSEQNLGYQRNWNKCIENSNSDYTVILHSDDMLKPDTIAKQIKSFKENPDIAIVGGQEDSIDEQGNIISLRQHAMTKSFKKGQIYEFVAQTNSYIPCSSVMFDMKKIRLVGYFDTDTIAVDELYWPKILQHYPVMILGESLILRRRYSGQTEYGDFVKYYPTALYIYKKFGRIIDYEKRPAYKSKVKVLLKKKFSMGYINIISISLAFRGYKKVSIGYLFYAFRINPFLIFDIWKIKKVLIKIVYYLALK